MRPYLDELLDALARQARTDFEVVIVDNNPVPRVQVPAVPGLRIAVVHEPRLGLSAARNTGVARAASPCVAFLDDDSLPEPSWLDALVSGLQKYGAAAAGGAVRLGFSNEPPAWLDAHLRKLLAELRYDGVDVPALSADQYIGGGNMIVRGRVFHEIGGFRETFGRVGDRLRSSEEVEWCCRARAAGHAVAFIAGAQIEHRVPAGRMQRRYFLRRGYWQGRTDARL